MSRKQTSRDRLASQHPIGTHAKPSPEASSGFHPALAALTRLLARQIASDLAATTNDAVAKPPHQDDK